VENKAKNALRDRGVRARKDEKKCQAFIKANSGLVGIEIPDSMWVPIQTLKKTQLPQRKKIFEPINRCTRLSNLRSRNGTRVDQRTLWTLQPFPLILQF